MNQREVVVLSGVRTAIGTYGGTLKDQPPVELGAAVVREAVSRSKVAPSDIGHVVFGNVMHTDARDMYLARYAGVRGGLPIETPMYTLNRLCGSGLQAIVSAAQVIMLGDADATVAGGAEVMSRVPYWLPSLRWGARMNHAQVLDALIGGLGDPFEGCHMGITGENIAKRWKISREEQDEYAVESHRRAAQAIADGRFQSQILPVEIKQRKKTITFDTDEHVRVGVTLEDMGKLKPAFTLGELRKAGVKFDDLINDRLKAALITLDTDKGKEYWLGLDNFYTITRYNHSPMYAMAVWQLGNAILEAP